MAEPDNTGLLEVIHQILENNRIIREKLTTSDPDKVELVEKLKSQLEIEDRLIRELVRETFDVQDRITGIARKHDLL